MLKAYILIDRSASMMTRWAEVLGSVNTYIAKLAAAPETAEAVVTVATFDAAVSLNFDVVRDAVKVSDCPPISDKDAVPRGSTPLFDAIGRFSAIVDRTAEKVTAVIITDGEENASSEVTRQQAKAILDDMTARKWDIVFMGANFDAFGQGGSVGVHASNVINTVSGSMQGAAEALAAKAGDYSLGNLRGFTPAERAGAGGKSGPANL